MVTSQRQDAPKHSQSSLTSQASLLIDPTWNNPHLVYWYDNQINGDIYV